MDKISYTTLIEMIFNLKRNKNKAFVRLNESKHPINLFENTYKREEIKSFEFSYFLFGKMRNIALNINDKKMFIYIESHNQLSYEIVKGKFKIKEALNKKIEIEAKRTKSRNSKYIKNQSRYIPLDYSGMSTL